MSASGRFSRNPTNEQEPRGTSADGVTSDARWTAGAGVVPRRVSLHPALRAVLLAALLIVLGLLFRQLVTLLLAVLIAVIVSIPLSAAATQLERLGVPRVLGVLLALIASLAFWGGVLWLVVPPFIDQVNKFLVDLPGIVNSLRGDWHRLTGARIGDVGVSLQRFAQGYTNNPGHLLGTLASVGQSVATVLGAVVLIVLSAVYIAIKPEPLVNGLVRLFPPDARGRVLAVVCRIRGAWVGWMMGVGVAMVVLGVVFYIGLLIVGLPFALVFSVFSAVSVVVPYFGALASGLPPMLYALTLSPSKALGVVVVYVVAHQVEGNVIGPLVMSRAVKLHAAVIAVGVLIIGQLLGAVGLIVAVPILVAAVILVEELWVKPLEEHATEALELPTPQHHSERYAERDSELIVG